MSEQLTEVRTRERVLTERIDMLENGPGCARELAEQLETAEVLLNQEQARQRQRRVMAEMLTVNNDAAVNKRGSTDGKTGGGLTKACQAKHPDEPWLCFMSPHMQDSIETPFFMCEFAQCCLTFPLLLGTFAVRIPHFTLLVCLTFSSWCLQVQLQV